MDSEARRKFNDFKHLHDASFERAKELQAQYDYLLTQFEPRIAALSDEADALAVGFKRLARDATEAYSTGQKELASTLASDRRAKQAECEALNGEANRYREALAEPLNRLKTERSRVRAVAGGMKQLREGGYAARDDEWFVTVNNTDDDRFPHGSYYVSYGEPNRAGRHVTVIYDAEGNYLSET